MVLLVGAGHSESANIEKVSKDIDEREERVRDCAVFMVEKGVMRWVTMADIEITKEGIEGYERTHDG